MKRKEKMVKRVKEWKKEHPEAKPTTLEQVIRGMHRAVVGTHEYLGNVNGLGADPDVT